MVALTTLGVIADDSAPFFLNTAKGTRFQKKTELISYSTEWDKGTSVRVTADGATLKEAVAPASGDVVWDGAKASKGLHSRSCKTQLQQTAAGRQRMPELRRIA